MNKNISFILVLLTILTTSIAILIFISSSTDKSEIFHTDSYDQKRTYKKYVNSLNFFRKETNLLYYKLKYGFIDYHGKKQYITFKIENADHRRSTNEFGYNKKSIYLKVKNDLQDYADKILTKSGLSKYVKIKIRENDFQLAAEAPKKLLKKIRPLLHEIMEVLKKKRTLMDIESYEKYGFVISNKTIRVNYNKLVKWNQPKILNCFKSLYRAGKGYSLKEYLGMFLAFIQEIKYEIPPRIWKGKNTGGVWTPTEVLINNHGDCDSKTVTFFSLWKNFRNSGMIMILIPGHTLAGIEMTPGPGQQYFRIGNRYYIICEVAGPGKLYPGFQKSVKGKFKYQVIN